VVNLSLGIGGKSFPKSWDGSETTGNVPRSPADPYFHTWYWLKQLVNAGVVVVVPAGNDANLTREEDGLTMRTLPAIWATRATNPPTNQDIPLLVSTSSSTLSVIAVVI
jgi:hypothetical protein